MAAENLDLDINNYSIRDLEAFFQIPENTKYTPADLETKEYEIREELLQSGQVNRRFKRNLIEFLAFAKDRLAYFKCAPIKPPTTVPTNQRLDPYEFPVSAKTIPRTDELAPRPDTNFVYTNPSEYFQGNLNPLNTRILTKCLNIDTRFRDQLYSTQSSDFTIQMPVKFNKVVSMQLSALEFPNPFYGISSQYGNHFLYVQVSTDISGSALHNTQRVFIIPDGNYTNADLVTMINGLLCPKNGDGSIKNTTDAFSYIQMVLDLNANGSGTNKITIAPTGLYANNIKGITLDFTKDIQGNTDSVAISSKIGWNLGFIQPSYTGKKTYQGDTVMDLQTIRYVYLSVDDFHNNSNNSFISVFQNSTMNPNILARISTQSQSNISIITEPRQYFGPIDIQRLRIRLYDEYGRILSTNSSNYSFCLTLKLLYDL